MAINNNKNIAALYNNGIPLVLNSIDKPTNTYADIYLKKAVHITAADCAGMQVYPASWQTNNTFLRTLEIPNTISGWVNSGGAFSGCNLDAITYQANPTTTTFGAYNTFSNSNIKNIILPAEILYFGDRPIGGGSKTIIKISVGENIQVIGKIFTPTTISHFIILKQCLQVEDVPTFSDTTYGQSTANWWFIDNDTRTSFAAATNIGVYSNKMRILNKLVIDGDTQNFKYLAVPYINSENMQTALEQGLLANEISYDITQKYDFYQDSTMETAFDLTQTVQSYIDLLGEGFTIYAKTKEVEE